MTDPVTRTYHVSVSQVDESHARIATRGHELTLNIKKGSGEAGFNAAETLLAALGTCLLTNVTAIGQKMHLDIRSARVEFDAIRRDEPPAMTEIHYQLILESSESHEKLEELHDLSIKWSTVTNTLIDGIHPKGKVVVVK